MHSFKGRIILFFLAFFWPLSHIEAQVTKASQYPYSSGYRDPFSALVSKSGLILIPRQLSLADLVLKGIIYSEGEPLAIISDEILKEGETIADYTLIDIGEKKVTLEKNKEIFILKLEEE